MHSDDKVREWLATVVLPDCDASVIERETFIVALLAFDGSWVDQLHVDPQWTGN